MKNDGTNTARMQSMASSRGTAVSARAVADGQRQRLAVLQMAWMFSIATVASSTRMPIASARPPSVIRLIVCPVIHRASTAAISASGMFSTTTSALRQSRKKEQDHEADEHGAQQPSVNTLDTARVTYGDWSNSKLTLMPPPRPRRPASRATRFLMLLMTLSVEASARLVARMYTARRPLTSA